MSESLDSKASGRFARARTHALRPLWAIPLAFGCLYARGVLATGGFLAVPELLYLASQAIRLGSLVALLLFLLAWFDARTPGKKASWVMGLLLVAAAPKAYEVAHYAAHADAVVRRGLPVVLVVPLFLAMLLALMIFVWAYQRLKVRPRKVHLLAIFALGALVLIDVLFGFSQAGLAPFCYGLATLLLTVLFADLTSQGSSISSKAALSLTALMIVAGAISSFATTLTERGRAALHRTPSSLAHLDMHLSSRTEAPSLVKSLAEGATPSCPEDETQAPGLFLPSEQRKNLIFISIDTLRADDAVASVNGKPLMPELLGFIKESWSATRAYSAYPATLLSLSAAFSGYLPSRLLMSSPPPRSVLGPTLTDYRRVAVLPRRSYFEREPIEQYIVQGATRITETDAHRQTRVAIETLTEMRAKAQPHVLWIHYFEPHGPYQAHADFAYGSGARERYWSELSYVDRELGQLLKALRTGGWYEDSLIFVFSDHGEAFGEHAQEFHHYQLYPWLIRVPFAMHVPGQAPRVFEGPVGLVDLAPTALHFLGASAGSVLDGRSLLSEPPPRDRVILSEEFPIQLKTLSDYAQAKRSSLIELERRAAELEYPSGYPSKISIIQREQQLILHRGTGVVELYDLARDPLAEHNLGADDDVREGALRYALDAWFGEVAQRVLCEHQGQKARLSSARP